MVDNAVFGASKRLSDMVIPWCTYTMPEVAHVGLYEAEVEGGCDTYKADLAHNDRVYFAFPTISAMFTKLATFTRGSTTVADSQAILEGSDEGFFKVHCKKGTDVIVGATIVADTAGDSLTSSPTVTL